MCYSAQVQADYKKYVTMFGASMGIREFYEVFYRRGLDAKIKIPKAVEAAFANPETDDERAIKALIDEYNAKQAAKFEEELFKQRKRLADAERVLQGKPTKKAQEDQRIASDKIRHLMGRHADLKRTELLDRDSRIFPGSYVPVMIWEDGKRVIKPMRYGCRPAGKPAFYDVKYPGTYNARRDNLQGFWKGQFGHTHGLRCTAATLHGTGSAASWFRDCPAPGATCRRSTKAQTVALVTTASAAFHPKVENMKALSHCQVEATINTGGAAYDVKVPPIETLTNSTPSARYLTRSGTSDRKICGASISAAMVIAAGSVTTEPSSGTAARPSHAVASGVGTGSTRAATRTSCITTVSTGREAATTITTNTNSGSV